jgi:LmbE family N-acetylglucosaminyl deacetylase
MAIYAHPDDADVAAGGTLATWAQAGVDTHLVVVCDGSKGTHVPLASAANLALTRERELREAATILGVRQVYCLQRPDGEVTNEGSLREELVRLIRHVKPDVVIGPDPTAVFFGGVYVNHRDHRETGWAVLDAVAPASAMPQYYPSTGEAHQVATLLLSGTHEPDVVVAIEGALEAKVDAVLAHQSQTEGDRIGIDDVVRGRAAQAGRSAGVSFAEAFRCVTLGG